LEIDERDFGSGGIDFNVSGGVDLDIIKHPIFTLYCSLEAGYKLNLAALNFEKDNITGKSGNVYYYYIVDQLNFGEEFSGPFYGLAIGIIF